MGEKGVTDVPRVSPPVSSFKPRTSAKSEPRNFQLAFRIGVYGLKTALMVNALAAGVFLILTNFSRSVPDYVEALAWFGLAAIVTIIGFCIGYCCRLPYPNGLMDASSNMAGKPRAAHNGALTGFIGMLAIAAIASSAADVLGAPI